MVTSETVILSFRHPGLVNAYVVVSAWRVCVEVSTLCSTFKLPNWKEGFYQKIAKHASHFQPHFNSGLSRMKIVFRLQTASLYEVIWINWTFVSLD